MVSSLLTGRRLSRPLSRPRVEEVEGVPAADLALHIENTYYIGITNVWLIPLLGISIVSSTIFISFLIACLWGSLPPPASSSTPSVKRCQPHGLDAYRAQAADMLDCKSARPSD